MRPVSKVFILLTLFFSQFAPPVFSKSSSFFSVGWKDGKAWFLDNQGKPFLSMGINHIVDESKEVTGKKDCYSPVKSQFKGDQKAWVKSVFARLKKWHFNTVGSWSDEIFYGKKFPYTYMTYVGRGPKRDAVLEEVFSPDFEAIARQNAARVAPYKDDPYLIGYFLDNEMPWWGEFGWRTDSQKSLLEKYAAGGVDDANKRALVEFFKGRYADDVEKMNQVWGTSFRSFEDLKTPAPLSAVTRKQKADANAWAGKVAERYFKVTTQALRAVDPYHLILGVRFAGEAPWEVVEACGKYCDVVSVNHYQKSGDINKALLDNFYARTRQPLLITEYSFRAMENQSGDPNTKGADVTVPTQKERAEHFDRFARQMLNLPYVTGLHWFEWADEPPQGRFDGEDSNYGLVDIHDKAYALVTQKHSEVNLKAPAIHQKSGVPLPGKFMGEVAADYRKAPSAMEIPQSRLFLKTDKPVKPFPWGDKPNGGDVASASSSGVLALDYITGTGWGCGMTYTPNVEPLLKGSAVDLMGYSFIEFKAFVPAGLNFAVYVAETGANDPAFKGENGADGESYGFPLLKGTGKWETYRVDLADLERRNSYGNQAGNNILDLQGLADVEFYFPGNQGAGKVLLKDVEFKVK